MRAAVVRMPGLGVEDPGDDLPSTGAATAAIERAGREASALGAEQVGTEHILLALMHEGGGAASRILWQLDVDPVAIRSAIGDAGSSRRGFVVRTADPPAPAGATRSARGR